jgi:predicted transposase YdaD
MGLKYDPKFVEKLMGKNVLELSSTYQALMKEGLEKGIELGREQGLEQGKEEALRASLLRIGEKRLGKPTETVLATLGNVRDSALLEQLLDKTLEAESWDELLAA